MDYNFINARIFIYQVQHVFAILQALFKAGIIPYNVFPYWILYELSMFIHFVACKGVRPVPYILYIQWLSIINEFIMNWQHACVIACSVHRCFCEPACHSSKLNVVTKNVEFFKEHLLIKLIMYNRINIMNNHNQTMTNTVTILC